MKPKIKMRELWLFAPFLLIIAGAFYWQRVERVSKPGASGMYVSGFEIEAAPGYYQEQGITHFTTVKVAHFWPRPRWWGNFSNRNFPLDPLHPATLNSVPPDLPREKLDASGAVLTLKSAPHNIVWPKGNRPMNSWPSFVEGEYIYNYSLRADELPAPPQALDFRGVYRLAGSEPLTVTRSLGKSGETLSTKVDKSPGGQLISIDALPFFESTSYPRGKTPIVSDICYVYFLARTSEANDKHKAPALQIYDLLVRDEKSKIYRDYAPKGFSLGYGGASTSIEKAQLRPNEVLTFVAVNIERATPTAGELTLSGKVSISQHWPIPFRIKLAPRALSGRENTGIPEWRRPASAPIR